MTKAVSRTTAAAALFATMALAGAGLAQRAGRVLHRPIPGDVPLDEVPAAMPAVPPTSSEAIARASGQSGWRGAQNVSTDVQRPRAAWDAPAREMDRQTQSAPNTRLQYQEVFTPSVQPFKRSNAYDMVDELGRMTVRDPSLRPIQVGAPAPASWAGHRVARFVGEVLVELSASWHTPIPAIAGEQRVLSYTTTDGESVEFLTDGAANLFVRGLRTGTVRLTYVIEAPDFAFAADRIPAVPVSDVAARVPEALRPSTPSWLDENAQRVLRQLGLDRSARFDQLLGELVRHFRSFRDASLEGEGRNLYVELALNRVGACRHRAYAMMLTLHALGIPARYVGNEAHAWVEVYLGENGGWSRIDLGGWDVPLDTRTPSDRPAFRPAMQDHFARPATYERQFSANATGSAGGDGGAWIDPDASVGESSAQDSNSGGSSASGASGAARSSASNAGNTASAARSESASGAQAVSGGSAVAERTAESRARPDEAAPSAEEDDAPRQQTATQIASVLADDRAGYASAGGFARGSMVRIVGFVRDVEGLGVSGLAVELQLVRNGRAVQGLGTAATGADGRFEAHVLLNATLEAGDYQLLARTPGDARYAASIATE